MSNATVSRKSRVGLKNLPMVAFIALAIRGAATGKTIRDFVLTLVGTPEEMSYGNFVQRRNKVNAGIEAANKADGGSRKLLPEFASHGGAKKTDYSAVGDLVTQAVTPEVPQVPETVEGAEVAPVAETTEIAETQAV